ncbi:hypothetical protein ACFPRL_20075 [Pseudoclavibacter helvolus]
MGRGRGVALGGRIQIRLRLHLLLLGPAANFVLAVSRREEGPGASRQQRSRPDADADGQEETGASGGACRRDDDAGPSWVQRWGRRIQLEPKDTAYVRPRTLDWTHAEHFSRARLPLLVALSSRAQASGR